MNIQVEHFRKQIEEKLPVYGTPEKAAQAVREFIEQMGVTPDDVMLANLQDATELVKASLKEIQILRRNSLVKPRDDWYNGPKPIDRHWPALKGYLEHVKNWEPENIQAIHESSSEVVSLLANPKKDQFRCRGLVVGYVQSGKTANMTAVISKAVDAGYNLIVLLAGITNKLRAQTQVRLEQDIVERHRTLWQLYTTKEELGDFCLPANSSFTMPVDGSAQLVVMKKVTSRLEAFSRTLDPDKTPPAIMRSLKVLLIDDECDQASVNSAKEEYDITTINKQIRTIIKKLPAVSYVGYTATPFANVFIDPFSANMDDLDDLYPEDFITCLPRSKGYFGTREVFGTDPFDAADEEAEETGLDMIRVIPDTEIDRIRPRRASDKDSFHPELTDHIESSLLWFLLSCAIRRGRGQAADHMSMLIHTSPNVIQHDRMANEVIRPWIKKHKHDLVAGRGYAWQRMQEIYKEETARVALSGFPAGSADASILLPFLKDVLEKLEVVVENGEMDLDERLNYRGEAKSYIVIGGSVLARGLTLEGLTVSFFLRTSKQYDTLLQMGRWFGYRNGYDDLPRLWTTKDLKSSFRSLAAIEEEIREDIALYKERNATPKDFAVKVRSIPGMAITAASKMKRAIRTSISFEGRHIQTIRFDYRSPGAVEGNWDAASAFMDTLLKEGECQVSDDRRLIRNVPFRLVRRFLADYSICDQHMDLRKDMLLGYLDKGESRLHHWNVGLICTDSGNLSEKPLGEYGQVNMNMRSRLQATPESYADIKALMSKSDVLIDAEDKTLQKSDGWETLKKKRPAVPLLLIYPIDRNSRPRESSRKIRTDLDALGDLIGIGVVFPGTRDRAGDYYAVELDAVTPEEIDEEELELDEEYGSIRETS